MADAKYQGDIHGTGNKGFTVPVEKVKVILENPCLTL